MMMSWLSVIIINTIWALHIGQAPRSGQSQSASDREFKFRLAALGVDQESNYVLK